MAWVDTLLTLRGSTGQRGSTGVTGHGGGGLRTYATVYSNNDPTKGALHSIDRNVSPGFALSPLSSQTFTPTGVVVDYAGTYYFTSETAHIVYSVDTNGTLATVMGTGVAGDYVSTVPEIAINVPLNSPYGIAINSERTIIYVSCFGSNLIMKYDIITRNASAVETSLFSGGDRVVGPRGICLAKVPNGSGSVVDALFIANEGNNTVGQYTMGPTPRYNRIAGVARMPGLGPIYGGFAGDGGSARSATLFAPRDVCQVVGDSGQSILLIADSGHFRVRQVTISGATETSGTITTVVGNGVRFLADDVDTNPLGNAVYPFGLQYAKETDTLYISSDRRLRAVNNFRSGAPSLASVVGKIIVPSTTWANIGREAYQVSVSSLYGNVHIDYNGNIITPGNRTNPLLVYTTISTTISAPLPAPVLGDIVNWITRYDSGSGLVGLTKWVYNTYATDYLSGVTFPARWTQIGSSVLDVPNAGLRGVNSSVTGATGAAGPTVRGPLGPTGPRQIAAPDGPAGPTGLPGITNNIIFEQRGPTGHEGVYGDTGPRGPAGPSPDGATGPDGQRGIQGVRHANFYQDIPFPQASVAFLNPFPESSLPGDYYIKEDTTKLYYYSETVPPNSYYLNRVLDTSSRAINSMGISTRINTETHAKGTIDHAAGLSSTERNAALAYAKEEYAKAEKLFYQYQTREALYQLDIRRRELASSEAIANSGGSILLSGSTTPWTTRGSPYVYEFLPATNSVITTSFLPESLDNHYAVVAIDGTFVDGIYVVAGHRNPLFQDTDTSLVVNGKALYIISTVNLTGNLPYVNYQIFWYRKNVPVHAAIPPSALVATYVGVAVNKKVTSTPSNPTGYDVSLFFTNANCGSYYYPESYSGPSSLVNRYVQFDNKNKLPDNTEAAMLYGLDGSPVIGDYANQFPWRVQNHFGGLIELKMSVTVSDIFSGGFAIPTNGGKYGLLNVSQDATNNPMFPNNYTSSLVTTVRFPSNTVSVQEPQFNPVTSNVVTPRVIAVHPSTRDVYFTQAVRNNSSVKTGESLLLLKTSDREPDGFTYSDISVLFSRSVESGFLVPDGTALADVGCNNISGMTFDNVGNLYYSDSQLHCVRKINLFELNPIVTTVAGVYPTFVGMATEGNSIAGSIVRLSNPRGLCCRNGFLYIVDSGNHRVVRVDIAYRGLPPITIGGGDEYPAGKRPGLMNSSIFEVHDLVLNNPSDVEVDVEENIYITDTNNHCIWRANLAKNQVVLFVGSWHYAGVDVPQDQPRPNGPEIWEWVMIAIAIVVVIVAVVVTFGAAAPAAAPLAPVATVPAAVTPPAVVPVFAGAVAPALPGIPGVLPPVVMGTVGGVTASVVVSVPTVTAAAAASGVASGYLAAITTKTITLTVLATGATIAGLSM